MLKSFCPQQGALKACNSLVKILFRKSIAKTLCEKKYIWQRDQIAGSSLEPLLPLTTGNNCEELV